MHFQVPPHDHQKIIYCIRGRVLDVLLDLRKSSPTFGQAVGIELSQQNKHLLFVPKGFAHGFLSLENDSCLVYKTDAVHAPQHDQGIRWDSFGFDWPNVNPLVSGRDLIHTVFADFSSPF